jgi:hypothetical protein
MRHIAFWLVTPRCGSWKTPYALAGIQPGTGTAAARLWVRRPNRFLACIFDRSFCHHLLVAGGGHWHWLGIAASFSAQVFFSRREFGLLVHLAADAPANLLVVAMEGTA